MRREIAAMACPIERGLAVVGERWTFLILREAFLGTTRFADFRARLGIATDVLAERLAHLVAHGVLSREPYREPGSRARSEYHLTPKGRDLKVVLGAMQQWGERYLPRPEGPPMQLRSRRTARPLDVAFVDEAGRAVEQDEAAFARAPSAARAAEA
jgi:DNA-binding HxlR family transcriptional regulator